MLKLGLMLLILSLFINSASAHVCDDVLRYDPIEIRPEVRTLEVIETGEFKIFLKNNYGAPIHNVRVIVPENIFDIKVNPALIGRVDFRQEVYFLVKITISEHVKPGRYPLVLKVGASEFEATRDVQVTLEVKRREEAVVEIIPEDIPVAISVFPDMIEVEPGQNVEFRVYVRNGHTKSIHNISLFINESEFRVEVIPEVIEELKPGDTTYFLVNLFVPANIEHGDYMLSMEMSADEFAVRRGVGAMIRVGEVREEMTYLYLLILSFIIFVLVWRKLSLKRSKQHLMQ